MPPADDAGPLMAQAVRELKAAIDKAALQIQNAARIAEKTENAALAILAHIERSQPASKDVDWSISLLSDLVGEASQLVFRLGHNRGGVGVGAGGMANDVKSLANGLRKASTGVTNHVARLRDETRRSACIAAEVAPLLKEMKPVFSALRAAAEERDGRIAQLKAAVGTAERPQNAAAAADRAQRRRHPRYTVQLPVELYHGDTTYLSHTLDVSEGGMLVAAVPDLTAPQGTVVEVRSERLGLCKAKIAARSRRGLHLQFIVPAKE